MRAMRLMMSVLVCAFKLWAAEVVMTPQDLLYAAAEKGDVDECLRALLEGAKLDLPQHKMETALSIAISHRRFNLVLWLLKGKYLQALTMHALSADTPPQPKALNNSSQSSPRKRQKNTIAPAQNTITNGSTEPNLAAVSGEGESQRQKKITLQA